MSPSNKRVPTIRFSGFVEEWKENKVADLAERFYGGGTPSTIASEYWGGETAWIQSSDLGEGELFNVVPKRKVTLKALKETNIQLIPANSIAVVTRVGVGKLALMEYSYTTSQDFCSLANLRANPAMLSYLLYLELNYKGVSVQGTAIKGITKNDLDSINLFIPDGRSEQSRIGQFFRTLDKLIELRKKKLDKLIALKKELLNKLFPQQGQKIPAIRFSGFVEEWRGTPIGKLMEVSSVKRIHQWEWKQSGVRFLRARDVVAVINNEEVSEKLYISQETYEKNSSLSGKVQIGDILVTGVGTIGVPFLITSNEPLYFKDGNIIWLKNCNMIDGNFLYFSYLTDRMMSFISSVAGTGTVGTYTIESGKKTILLYPQKIEQSRIGQFFRTLDKLIELRKKEVDKMTALKKELLNKLFVG